MFMPYYYKSRNTLTNQGTHNLPLSSTLKLWEVLTWPSQGIRPAPQHCSLLGPFFFVLCICHRDYVCTVWLIVDFLASSNTINSVSKRGLFFTLQTPSKSTTNSTANNKHTKKKIWRTIEREGEIDTDQVREGFSDVPKWCSVNEW